MYKIGIGFVAGVVGFAWLIGKSVKCGALTVNENWKVEADQRRKDQHREELLKSWRKAGMAVKDEVRST